MGGFIDATLAVIADNRAWTAPIAFLFAFGETLALVSILIPSTAILIGIGALASTGAIDFLPLWIGAAVGAVAGSTVSWWAGWLFGERMLSLWPLSKAPENVSRGVELFRRWGVLAVVIGHFFGPFRSVVFLLAGATRLGFLRFQLVNVPAALAWAWVVPKTGEVGGDIAGAIWRALGL
ncbi:MAG: DedA family protein [Paracoccaceae bacterium]